MGRIVIAIDACCSYPTEAGEPCQNASPVVFGRCGDRTLAWQFCARNASPQDGDIDVCREVVVIEQNPDPGVRWGSFREDIQSEVQRTVLGDIVIGGAIGQG